MNKDIRVDLMSDTVTLPSDEMRYAMANATVGDDVYGEDETANELEKLAARTVGKDAALYVPSGGMANIIAVMTHCGTGDEVILERTSHICDCEVGALGALAGVNPYPLDTEDGILHPHMIEPAIREDDVHFAKTGLICVENPHNRRGGIVTPPDIQRSVSELAKKHGIPLHLDGARIFNAATFLKVDPKEIAQNYDTLQFCLSKGLSCPIGSILAGSAEFIELARKKRKLLGGGMRQVGFVAAAGVTALQSMIMRLQDDHDNAARLARALAELPLISLNPESVQTNMIYIRTDNLPVDCTELNDLLIKKGVRGSVEAENELRLVTHYGIDTQDIDYTIEVFTNVIRGFQS